MTINGATDFRTQIKEVSRLYDLQTKAFFELDELFERVVEGEQGHSLDHIINERSRAHARMIELDKRLTNFILNNKQ